MSITAPDLRITEYNPVVATTDFPAVFPVFDNDDIKVFVDGVEHDDFAVTATYDKGISNNAKAVFAVGVTGKVQVVGARDPHRTNRFNDGGPLPPRDFNLALDTLEAEMQEAARDMRRAHKAPFGSDGAILDATVILNAQMYAEQAQQAVEDATQLATPADGTVTDIKLAALQKVTNRKDDICDIRDYNAGGSVDGGNATRFTDAWEAAYADNVGKNVTVRIPKPPNGQDWLLEPVVLGDVSMNSQGKIAFVGDGAFTKIKPAGPGANLITVASTFTALENLMIDDTDNGYLTSSAIYTVKAAMDALPMYITRVFGLGLERVILNDIADNVLYTDIRGLNCTRIMDFNSGGTESEVNGVWGQGFREGIVLNSDTATHPDRIHPEGLTIRNPKLYGGGAFANAIGIWAIDTLDLNILGGTLAQMGVNGKCLFMDGQVGKGNAWMSVDRLWCDVGPGGWNFYAQGINLNPEFKGCRAGASGVPDGSTNDAVSRANGWFFDSVEDFVIETGVTADPDSGTANQRFYNAAAFVNSFGKVKHPRWNSGLITENGSAIIWDSDWVPAAAGRSVSSEYLRNGWTPYNATVIASTGTLTTVSCDAAYIRVGKTVTIRVTATITTNGSGSGSIQVSLPIAARTGTDFCWQGPGREDGVTGKMLQVRVTSGGTAAGALFYDNTYPGANGAKLQFEITYECA